MATITVEVRCVRGVGEWGGSPLGFRWVPAITGTLNQTGLSDDEASTFTTLADAQAAVEAVRSQFPDDAGYECRLVHGAQS